MLNNILYGRKKPMTLPTGEKRMSQYVIVDLDEIKASHSEETFSDTVGYPINEHGRNINDRNYKNDTAAQQTVISIAQNLDADKLIEYGTGVSGTPIIDKSGIVVSGNNRVMSLKLAAKKFPDQYKNYVETLAKEADIFGFPESTADNLMHRSQFTKPVLVRIDENIPVLNTTELAKYNLNAKKGERPVDKAIKLGNILRENERCRNVILSVVDGYETFSDLYSPGGKNDRKKLVSAFIDCGLIPEQQMVSYYNEGEFTDQGKDFVESILSAMILTPDALAVAGLEGVKRLRQTIVSSLPVLITNENLPEGSLQPYISEAIIMEHRARQVGGDFSDYMYNQTLFGEDNFQEKSYYLNRLLNQGRNVFKEAIKRYNEGIQSNSGNSMFAGEQLNPDEIFKRTIAKQVPTHEAELINKKFAKSTPMPGTLETSIVKTLTGKTPAPVLEHAEGPVLWANDAWFAAHPDKVLGIAYEASGRFGPVTKYRGTLDDLNKIEVPDNFIGNMKAATDPLASVVAQRNPELDALQAPMRERIEEIIHQSEKEVDSKLLRKTKVKRKKDIEGDTMAVKDVAELQSFEEIYYKYNTQISKDELEVFIWWKSHTGKPLSRRWVNLVKPHTYSGDALFIPTAEEYNVPQEKIKHWVTQGLLFYYNGKYEPEVIYLSGNVYDKKAQIERDKDKIIELYGNEVYEKQKESFSKAFRKKYDTRLLVTGEAQNGLALIPISKFAENFEVSRLDIMVEDQKFKIKRVERAGDDYGKPDFVKDPEYSDYKRTDFETLNLKYAFAFWLQRGSPEMKEAISTMDIIRYYLLNHRLSNPYDKDEDKARYEEQQAKNEKLKSICQREGQRLFLFFLNDQLLANDKVRLETEWNANFNNHLPVDYNKIPVAFTMCKYYKGKPEGLRPEKREAVAFSLVEGSACLSYDVGVGKTPSAIFTISAFMDAGYCLRPFICVPNQVYKQFISEIKEFTPHIPVIEAYNLSEEYVKNFQDPKGNIVKVPAGTITVMTYEGLEQIGFSDATYTELFSELYEILNQGDEESQKKTKKQKQGFAEKLETLLGRGLRGTMMNIEDFGFDFGCYDEAHKMKKVFTAVKGEVDEVTESGHKQRGRNPYQINSGVPSSIGLKGFMLNYYIQRQNGWQNVLLLTATPFTNSPLEIFSVLSMVAYNKLKETDLNNLKSFFDTYVNTSTELVINAQLRPQFKQVILGFNNLLSLQTLIRRFINYKTGDQANVVRPKKYVLPYLRKIENETVIVLSDQEKIETYIPMTPAQTAMVNDVIAYVEGKMSAGSLRAGNVATKVADEDEEDGSDKSEGVEVSYNALNDKEKLGVRTIKGLNYVRNIALSPYLYEHSGMRNPSYRQYVETSPKLSYVMECIRTVKEYHENRNEPVSGQVIYMDRGTEYFELLKEYLVKEIGYQPDEVGIIMSGLPKNGKKSKEYIKNLFNGEIYNESTKLFEQVDDAQRIKVVIGSSTIKEGINLQKYGTVLYNCFLDWNPTDIQQLEGRIWRQGNTFSSVRIVNPLVIDSADIFIFQKLQEKTSRLNSIWATDGRKNVLNTEEFDPEELKYALIRDPKVIGELKSVEEVSTIEGDILSQERLIDRATQSKEVIGTINHRLDDMIESVKEYRDFQRTSSKLDDAERIVNVILDLNIKQTDKKGRKIYPYPEAQTMKYNNKWNSKKMISEKPREKYYGTDEDFINFYYRPYNFGDFALAVRDFKKLYSTFLNPFRIDVTLDDTKALDRFIEKTEAKITELKALKGTLQGTEYVEKLTQEIIAEREAKHVVYKTLPESVKEFTRLNFLLSDKKVAVVRQLTAVCPPMIGTERLIDDDSIKEIERCVANQTETKVLNIDQATGFYTPSRREVHARIVNDLFVNVKCLSKGKPLAIFTGGAPAAGKSTYLKKIPWLMDAAGHVNPDIFHIDADEIRTKLPEYTGWNASATHRETQDIVKEILDKLGEGNCKYDFIYDGTMNRPDKYFELINRAKKMGYETYIIFMDVPYNVSKKRALERYKKRGRYVPMEIIDDFFTLLPAPVNKTKGQYTLDQLKPEVDGYTVVNGVTGKVEDSKGVNLPRNRYYSDQLLVQRAEDKLAGRKKREIPPIKTGKTPEKKVKKEEIPPVSVPGKETIKKQIKGLTIAKEFAPDKAKIDKQIKALKIALEFAA